MHLLGADSLVTNQSQGCPASLARIKSYDNVPTIEGGRIPMGGQLRQPQTEPLVNRHATGRPVIDQRNLTPNPQKAQRQDDGQCSSCDERFAVGSDTCCLAYYLRNVHNA